jgi:Restriction endonuclease
MRDDDPLTQEWARLKTMADPTKRGFDFELFVGSLFGRWHFEVFGSPGAGGTRQVDLLATLGDETYLVETKWWASRKPGLLELQALEDRLKHTQPSVVGLFVSYSGFTQGAIDRVQAKPKRPILLVTGAEVDLALGWDGNFVQMVRRKRDSMLIDGKIAWMTGKPRRRPRRRQGALPKALETIVLKDGSRSQSLHSAGEFGQLTFVRELPDIDWVPGAGHGVTLDISMPTMDESDLVGIVHKLSDLGWITRTCRWSIQQSSDTWHGAGAGPFLEGLNSWQSRYAGKRTHHTEEFCFVDRCDDIGFYTLTGQIAASSPRIVWRTALSFQLSGIPIDTAPLRDLANRFDPGGSIFFRPRDTESVTRIHIGRRGTGIPLEVIGFLVESDEKALQLHEREWVVGVVANNPYRRNVRARHTLLETWPDLVWRSELIICTLRNWHPLQRPKQRYRLWSYEFALTSDGMAFAPMADWDDEKQNSPRRQDSRPRTATSSEAEG